MNDFIYDPEGKCVAWIIDGNVFAGETKRRIATVDKSGEIHSLTGDLVGHLEIVGSGGSVGSEAFVKLLK
jgi:hypothetical protein